jgi:hypothetical protein
MCRNDTCNREIISQWLILAVPALILRQHQTNKKTGTTLAVDPALHLPMKTTLFSKGINFNSNWVPERKTTPLASKTRFKNHIEYRVCKYIPGMVVLFSQRLKLAN